MESIIFTCFVLGIICAIVAANSGRSIVGWFFLGLFFGLFALIAIICLPALTDSSLDHINKS